MGPPPQYMAVVDAGIAGVEPGFDSESLPPPFMASVGRSEADLPSSGSLLELGYTRQRIRCSND